MGFKKDVKLLKMLFLCIGLTIVFVATTTSQEILRVKDDLKHFHLHNRSLRGAFGKQMVWLDSRRQTTKETFESIKRTKKAVSSELESSNALRSASTFDKYNAENMSDNIENNSDNTENMSDNTEKTSDNSEKTSAKAENLGSSLRVSGSPQTIKEYFELVVPYVRRQAIVLKWSPAGNLEKYSHVQNKDKAGWFDESVVQSLFAKTSPSEHGKVALVYNNDVAAGYKWTAFDVQPPIPMMFYTIPLANATVPRFIVIPNPYDRSGHSERRILRVQKELNGAPTFDQFQQRNNTIVWRGIVHSGDYSRKSLLALSDDASSWLDVADTKSSGAHREMNIIDMSKNYMYQIDIGGVSGTSWDGLRWKMCASGGLVFRVATHAKDWWHDTIQEWKHYVPVKADLSDLKDLYHWAEMNPQKVYDIAMAGREACLQTFSREYAEDIQKKIVESLPPSSDLVVAEADFLIDQGLESLELFHTSTLAQSMS